MIFNEEQAEFLKREFGLKIEPNENVPMSKEEWLDIKDKAFMIEGEEARPDGYLNDRCRVAVELVDMMYEE